MTSINWDKYPPVPGFDSLRMKREIQAKIYEETQGMTREEVRKYIQEGAIRFEKEQKLRHIQQAANKSKEHVN